MVPSIALQLYSLREELKKDFEGTIRSVAAMGYLGVETAGLPAGVSAQDAARLFRELGLQVPSAHELLPLGNDKNAVLDRMAAFGCKTIIRAWLDPKLYYQTRDQIKAAAELLNEANQVASANGLAFGYHNHAFEFTKVDGRFAYEWLLDDLAPTILLEVDTYWARTAGADVGALLQRLGARARLLHIKDGPCTSDAPMVAVGDGVMDFPKLLGAAGGHAEWLIVELDRCATDMTEAVRKSASYLTGKGLGRGRA